MNTEIANIISVTQTDGRTKNTNITLSDKEHNFGIPFTYSEVVQNIQEWDGLDLDTSDPSVIYATFIDEEGMSHRDRFDITRVY